MGDEGVAGACTPKRWVKDQALPAITLAEGVDLLRGYLVALMAWVGLKDTAEQKGAGGMEHIIIRNNKGRIATTQFLQNIAPK